ncbi:helix-turn-helix domain-containing protein [Haladaptatus sp. NG-SE-30]
MSAIADFGLPSEDFVLGHTVSSVSGMEIRIERVVLHGEGGMTPYFRAMGDDFDAFEQALREDETVTEVRTLEEAMDERFYRARWTKNVTHLSEGLAEVDATIVHAKSEDDHWRLRLSFADRDELSTFYDHCDEALSIDLRQVFDRSNPTTYGEYEVTAEQRDTLVKALEEGYFEVPRRITMDELAEEFDITTQSVSQRMRRGHANVLRNTIAPEESGKTDEDGEDDEADENGRDGGRS